MQVGARSDIGRVRRVNEDAYCALPGLFAVADGMGGHRAGEVASSLAVDVLTSHPFARKTPEEVQAVIQDANRRIYEDAVRQPKYAGMGTTITVALIDGDRLVIGHVGDSRAYLVRQGYLRQLTADHSVVGELLRNGGLTQAEAVTHPHRNLLTRALGTSPEVLVDVVTEQLAGGDILILCTDGLTNLVDDDELIEIVTGHNDPDDAVDRLVALANDRGGIDNVTVVVIRTSDE